MTKFTSPFAPLHIDERETQHLEELAHMLLTPVMEQFEAHLEDPYRRVDASRWKLVNEREDIHVYRARPASHQRSRSSGGSNFSDCASPHHVKELPVLLTIGTLQGSLYDIMYAVTNPTTEDMRIKTAYAHDGVINAAVLAQLKEPTVTDPFQSLSIKWSVQGQALHLRTLVNNRDLVYLEATGLTRLPHTGEVVGYQLLHSVEFPEAHLVPGCLRGRLSIVGLYRQYATGVVEMYSKCFVDPSGRIARALMVKSATESMLSVSKRMETAQRKKLSYALRRQNHQHAWEAECRRKACSGVPKTCSMCSSSLSSMAAWTFGKKRSASHCQLCLRVVCTTCRVKKELACIASDGGLKRESMPFCVACVEHVTTTNAFEIAIDELVLNREKVRYSFGSAHSFADTRSESASDRNGH